MGPDQYESKKKRNVKIKNLFKSMSDEFKCTTKKLNNENYQNWRYKLELILIRDGIWDVVNEEKPADLSIADAATWNKNDGKARAVIGLLLEDNQLIHVRKLLTAREYWLALQNQHEKSSLSNKVILLKKLCRIQFSGESMEDHICEMLNIVDRLSGLGENLADNLVVALLLGSLPDNYDTLITALEARPENDLTIGFVKEKLIQEHSRRNESTNSSDKALKTFDKKKQVKFQFKCNKCGQRGHMQKDCYAKTQKTQNANIVLENNEEDSDASNSEDSEASNDEYVCFKVHNEKKFVDEWFVDSAATCHMTNNKQFFCQFRSKS